MTFLSNQYIRILWIISMVSWTENAQNPIQIQIYCAKSCQKDKHKVGQ